MTRTMTKKHKLRTLGIPYAEYRVVCMSLGRFILLREVWPALTGTSHVSAYRRKKLLDLMEFAALPQLDNGIDAIAQSSCVLRHVRSTD
jgi:hypothetical protein